MEFLERHLYVICMVVISTVYAAAQPLSLAEPGMQTRGTWLQGARGYQEYNPQRLNWDSYIYKRFCPSTRERGSYTLDSMPRDFVMPHEALSDSKFGPYPIFHAGHAINLFAMHFHTYPDTFLTSSHAKHTGVRTGANQYSPYGDWSDYEVLRMDVRCMVDAHLWVAFEDQVVAPPVVANFDVKADTWVTLELDLARAATVRGIDLKDVYNFWIHGIPQIIPPEMSYLYPEPRIKAKFTSEILNIRLEKRGETTPYPVMVDPEYPDLPPLPARVDPPAVGGTPNLTPLKDKCH